MRYLANHWMTLIARTPDYATFIGFVKQHIAPHMEMAFVEEDYYEGLWEEAWTNQYTIEEIARGHSKTEYFGVWFTIFCAVYQPYNPFHEKARGQKKRIVQQLLITADHDMRDKLGDRIKDFFYKDPYLATFKPREAGVGKQLIGWNNQELILQNGSKIFVKSIKTKRGSHVDRIYADDLITEVPTLKDEDTINLFMGAIDGMGTAKEAMIQYTGTPLRATDVINYLKEHSTYKGFRRPAIKNWPKFQELLRTLLEKEDPLLAKMSMQDLSKWLDVQGLRQWKEEGIVKEMDALVLAPKRRNWSSLIRVMGRISSQKFHCEYLLEPVDDRTSIIKREWIKKTYETSLEGIWITPVIETKEDGTQIVVLQKQQPYSYNRQDWEEVFLGCDFQFSDAKLSDYSAFTIVAKKGEQLYRLGYLHFQGFSAFQQMEIARLLHSEFNFSMIGMEVNSIKAIEKEVRKIQLPIKLFWMGVRDQKDLRPEIETQYVQFRGRTHTVSKANFIERLGMAYENRKIITPYKTEVDKQKAFREIQELTSWTRMEGKIEEISLHPDIPIGTGFAMECSNLSIVNMLAPDPPPKKKDPYTGVYDPEFM